MSLKNCWELWFSGKYSEVLSCISTLENEDKLEGDALKSLVVYSTGSKYTAEEIILNVIKESIITENNLLTFKSLLIVAIQYIFNFDFLRSNAQINDSESYLTFISDIESHDSNNWLSVYYGIKGYIISIIEPTKFYDDLFEKSIKLAKEGQNKWFLALSLIFRSDSNQIKGDFILAGKYNNLSLDYLHEINNVPWEGWRHCSKGSLCRLQNDIKCAFENSIIGMEMAESYKDSRILPLTYNCIWFAFNKKGDIKGAIKFFEEKIDLYKRNNYFWGLFSVYNRLILIYQYTGRLKNAIEISNKKIDLEKKSSESHTLDIANTYENLGKIYLDMGNEYFDISMEFINKSIDLTMELKNNRYYLSKKLIIKSIILLKKGKIEKSLETINQSKKLLERHKMYGNSEIMGNIHTILGDVFRIKGLYELALKNYETSLNQFEEYFLSYIFTYYRISLAGDFNGWIESLIQIGRINHILNNNKEALRILEIALDYTVNSNDKLNESEVIFNIIFILIAMSKFSDIEKYQSRFNELDRIFSNPIVKLRNKVIKAYYLKSSPRMASKVKAMEVFQEIVDSNIVDFELHVFSMLNLCNLLIAELKSFGEEEVFIELKSYLDELLNIGKEQNWLKLVIETQIIQSKILLLEFKFEESNFILNNALHEAKEHNMDYLTSIVEKEIELFNSELKKWKQNIDTNLSLADKINQSELENYFKDIKKMLPEAIRK